MRPTKLGRRRLHEEICERTPARKYLQGEIEMTGNWLVGAAAFAMMTGVAFAQDRPSEPSTTTRSVTTSTAPAVGSDKSREHHWGIGSYKWGENHRDIDRDGSATRTKKTVHSNASGSTVTSKTRTEMPDGSRIISREKEITPNSGSSIEKKSTTTIDR
jgi:hypothetical protein